MTDIDARTCVEAGEVLETALGYFEKRIRPLAGDQAEPFRVYLFSGETGYQLYLAHTTFFPAESTSGVFMPAMQQLLIWNTPDRGQMLSTVRHEGLHQYMHRLVRDQPTWLGEGLAEYWESADFTKGTSRENAPTEGKLSALRTYQAEFLPLERFLHLPRADFYREAGLHYTQAWAFVHFLLQDDRVSRALFDGLLDALIAGASSEQALERVFGPLDLPALERSFRAHLRKLL